MTGSSTRRGGSAGTKGVVQGVGGRPYGNCQIHVESISAITSNKQGASAFQAGNGTKASIDHAALVGAHRRVLLSLAAWGKLVPHVDAIKFQHSRRADGASSSGPRLKQEQDMSLTFHNTQLVSYKSSF